jgi:WD40 repeat protein
MRLTFACLAITTIALLAPMGADAACSAGGKQNPPAKAKPARTDAFGDPLPDGVFYRVGTVRLRHEHTASLIFSADGSQLLSQGFTPDLRVWDVATGRILQQVVSPGGSRVIASRDDRYLACIRSNSYQMLLLDKATGKELARSESPTDCITLAFSRDSRN